MSTVRKALTLLNVIASLDEEAGLTELARRASYDKATARRLLVDLEAFGFVEQDRVTKHYRVGPAPVRLARIREARFPLTRAAMPIVKELVARSGETCHLSEYSRGELSSVYTELSPQANCVVVEVGMALPLHATASGNALLAFLPDDDLQQFLASPLAAYTGETVTDARQLEEKLNETRARGYSSSRNGFELGVASVAAPVLAPDGMPLGTIAIAAPQARVDKKRSDQLGRMVADAGKRLSARLYGLNGSVARTG